MSFICHIKVDALYVVASAEVLKDIQVPPAASSNVDTPVAIETDSSVAVEAEVRGSTSFVV